MPNWAGGDIEITGSYESVLSFSKRFIADDDPREDHETKFFARSFLNCNRSEVDDRIKDAFKGAAPDEERTAEIYVDFAWSAYGCLLDGYPQNFEDQCTTLDQACVNDTVDVAVRTSELGMCFEEFISCTRDGAVVFESKDLKQARCRKCGNIQSVASFEDLAEVECDECGEADMEWYKEEE